MLFLKLGGTGSIRDDKVHAITLFPCCLLRHLLLCRMLADGAQPNTKTFTALIGSVGKMGAVQQAMGIVSELLAADSPANAPATYSALLAACEKGGLWDLAISLFEKMCAEVSREACVHAHLVAGAHMTMCSRVRSCRVGHCVSFASQSASARLNSLCSGFV